MYEYLLIITITIGFLITVLLSPIFIPFLKRLKFGQSIREEGPKSHMKKSGTPTMGGLVIVISIVITTLIIIGRITTNTLASDSGLLLLILIGFGALGFIDDYIKVVLKRNLGLSPKQKLLGQMIIAIIFYMILRTRDFPTYLAIPGTEFQFELGWLYPVLVVIMIVGSSNAVNLTDGLDGLLSGTAVIAFGAFGILAWAYAPHLEIAIFSFAVVGALLGFLVFNAHPAKVFMGDTGSLALGAAIAAISILTKSELLLIIIGGIFVLEALSVMLQVAYFRTTGKRLFRMSPLHHHYELKGWSEWRVVATFWLVGFLFAFLGIFLEVYVG